MWFNSKLTIVAICCLSYGSVFGTILCKREVSSTDADTSAKDQGNSSDLTSWLTGLSHNGNKSSNGSSDSSNKTNDAGSGVDSTSDDLGLDTGFNTGSHNTTKDTGSDDSNTDLGLDTDSDLDSTGDSDLDSTGDSGFDTGSKKKSDTGLKKKTTKSEDSAKDTKNKKTNSSADSSSDLGTDDSYNWPNDQGSVGTNSTSGALTSDATSAASTTWDNTNANSTFTNDLLNKTSQNSSQNIPSPSSSTNFTSAKNATYPVPQWNTSSTGIPHVPTTTSTPQASRTKNNGFWIPIFNFGNNFYFMTNKGYAQLVNFPAPVIYSFKPVSSQAGSYSNPTPDQSEFFEEAEFISSFFEDESMPRFADCYISSSVGDMIPYSYFGSWVAVFQLEQGWHLQTYSGFVPLDLTGDDAPVRYLFEPIKYQYPTSVPTQAAKQGVHDAGLANWSEPVVVEN